MKKERVSIIDLRWKRDTNHVPIVAVFEELRFPAVPSKASGDRLKFPGASTSGDRSRKVFQFEVQSQENPGQASGEPIARPTSPGTGRLVAEGSRAATTFQERPLW